MILSGEHLPHNEDLPFVVVAEDDPGISRLVCKILERGGIASASALTAQETMEQVHANPGALLLIDYHLGKVTANQVIGDLTAEGFEVPFVVMTGLGDEETAVEMMKLGARDYVVKHTGFIDLIPGVIRNTLKELEGERKLAAAHEALEQTLTDLRYSEARALHGNKVLRAIRNLNQLITREADPGRLVMGACEILVENRGYESAWIITLAPDGPPVHMGEAGNDARFEALLVELRTGSFPPCATRAVEGKNPVIVERPQSGCHFCPLEGANHLGAFVARLEREGRLLGLMGVTTSREYALDPQEQDIFMEVVEDIAYALEGIERGEREEASRLAKNRLELELRHAQKMESVGQLASGIAHELNTPIQYVGDSFHFLRDACSGTWKALAAYGELKEKLATVEVPMGAIERLEAVLDECDIEYLEANSPRAFERIEQGLERVTSIVRSMKRFAHPDGEHMAPADINGAMEDTLVISRNEYKYLADVETKLRPLPAVHCSIGDLNQVFLNLIVNAAHAIKEIVGDSGDRGRISIATDCLDGEVVISVQDTGCGIPPEVRQRIFEPFFTTKDIGHGTGQGLALAYALVVDKHNGALTYESTEGNGTRFEVRLPLGSPQERAE